MVMHSTSSVTPAIGYIKLRSKKYIEHPSLLFSPGGDPIGVFFFFHDFASHQEAEIEAREEAHRQRQATGWQVIASIWHAGARAPDPLWIINGRTTRETAPRAVASAG